MLLVLVWVAGGTSIIIQLAKGVTNAGGAMCGVVLGVLLGGIALTRSQRLAQGGVFVDKMSPRERKVMFLIIWPLFIFGGIALAVVKNMYFAELEIGEASGTGLLFFIFVFSSVGVVGIYLLERRYGKKLYVGGRNASFKGQKPTDEQDNK